MSNIELKTSTVNIDRPQFRFHNIQYDFGYHSVFKALTDNVHSFKKDQQSSDQVTQSPYIADSQFLYKPSEKADANAPSPSIDVENEDEDENDEDEGDHIMSPVSITATQQKLFHHTDQRSIVPQAHAMELTTSSVPTGFPLNYQQLYANNAAALYGAPVMFSGAIHAAHASYMAGLPLHAALSPNESYLKAIQAAACGMYGSHSSITPPVTPNLLTCKPPSLHNPTGPMMALAPSAPVAVPKSPQISSMSVEVLSKSEAETKNDFVSSTPANTRLSSGNVSGTYLNDKVTDVGNDAGKDSHFKVPNGKEGSLKHRILRPPSNESIEVSKTPTMRTYSSTSNFKKGTYIELANGALRRVEDMRTEDFIQCAERSPQHQLAESTVVKINTSPGSTAVITFSYDRNRSKVDMEVSLDHPFFVYGQGWASCSPDLSMKVFGLKCQRLQVGDICISLTKRCPEVTTSNPEPSSSQRRHSLTSVPSSPTRNIKPPLNVPPEMPYAHMGSHAFPPIPAQANLPHPLTGYAEMAKLMSSYAYAKCLPQLPPEQLKEVMMDPGLLQSLPPKMMNAYYQTQIFQFAQQQQQQQQQQHQLQQEQFRRAELKYNTQQCTPPPMSVAAAYDAGANKSQSPHPAEYDHSQNQIHPLDASMSRKRRWSAPENMFDDDESEIQPHRRPQMPAINNNKSPPLPQART